MTGAGAGLPLGSLSLVPICLALDRLSGLLSSHCQGWLPSGGAHQVRSAAAWTPDATVDELGGRRGRPPGCACGEGTCRSASHEHGHDERDDAERDGGGRRAPRLDPRGFVSPMSCTRDHYRPHPATSIHTLDSTTATCSDRWERRLTRDDAPESDGPGRRERCPDGLQHQLGDRLQGVDVAGTSRVVAIDSFQRFEVVADLLLRADQAVSSTICGRDGRDRLVLPAGEVELLDLGGLGLVADAGRTRRSGSSSHLAPMPADVEGDHRPQEVGRPSRRRRR